MNCELDLTTAPARGNTKAAMKSAGARSADLWQVDPRQLQIMPGFNVRQSTPEYEQHIEGITQSIIANGYYPDRPIAGYVARQNGENIIYVIDGHTRLEAVMRAIERGHAIEAVPVVIKPSGSSMEDLTVALVTSNTGRPLSPMEIGLVCKRLLGLGLDEKSIAQRLGYTRTYIDNLLLLTGASRDVRDLVASGQVSATLAVEELKRDSEKAPERLQQAVKAAQEQGKAKATRKHLGRAGESPSAATEAGKPTPQQQLTTATSVPGLGPDTDLAAALYGDNRLVLTPEAEPGRHLGELRYQQARLDDYLDALDRYRTQINVAWDARIPVTEPNEHGVYTGGLSLVGRSTERSYAEIRLARTAQGWKWCVCYSLPETGNSSFPGRTDPDAPTATQAICAAAMELERRLRAAAKQKLDHQRTQKAVRQLLGWLLTLSLEPERAIDTGAPSTAGAPDDDEQAQRAISEDAA